MITWDSHEVNIHTIGVLLIMAISINIFHIELQKLIQCHSHFRYSAKTNFKQQKLKWEFHCLKFLKKN